MRAAVCTLVLLAACGAPRDTEVPYTPPGYPPATARPAG